MNWVKYYAKSIAAFLFTVLANAVTDLINGSAPWPQTGAEWLRWAVTAVAAGGAAWAFPKGDKPGQVPATPQPPLAPSSGGIGTAKVDKSYRPPNDNPWL
jgi:hypothetical protein